MLDGGGRKGSGRSLLADLLVATVAAGSTVTVVVGDGRVVSAGAEVDGVLTASVRVGALANESVGRFDIAPAEIKSHCQHKVLLTRN